MPPEFQFLRPGWLLLLPVVPLLLVWLSRARRDRRRWEAVCDPDLLPHVLIAAPPRRRRRWPGAVAAVCALLGIVAMAGPAWERLPQPVYRSQSALMIALDLSRSMLATDLPPSRLDQARYALRDILAMRADGQTGLLVFAADAFVVSPLTDDTATIDAQVPALEPGIMPAQGSRPERAIELAVALLQQAGARQGDILLITDGAAEPDAAAAAARAAAAGGYPVSVLAVGTPEGAPIPREKGGFVTDAAGGIVIPRLPRPELRGLARAGGGTYVGLDGGSVNFGRLAARWEDAGPNGIDTGRVTDTWLDRGPWVAALAVPLVLLGFRRGVLALAACALLPLTPQARADGWDDLWSRPDQQAAAALEAGEPERAQALFEDRRWRATAAYRAGDYEAAARALEAFEDVESLYNKGNALARAGRIEDAIASYEAALTLDAGHEDARYNRDLLRSLQNQGGQGDGQSSDGQAPDSQTPDSQTSGESGADGQGSREQQAGSESGQEGEGAEPGESGADAPSQPGGAGSGDGGRQGDPDRLSAAERSALDQQAARSAQADPQPGSRTANGPDGPDPEAQRQANGAAGGEEPGDGPQGEAAGEPAGAERGPGDPGTEDRPAETPLAQALAPGAEPDEAEQATEQWLRRIPDDPGGLLRRKFYYQYRERGDRAGDEEIDQAW
jgi:Ca-activated chloride channel family protein